MKCSPIQLTKTRVCRPAISRDGQIIAYHYLDPGLKAERILAFDWSRDGRLLAFVRGVETSDAVLIEEARK